MQPAKIVLCCSALALKSSTINIAVLSRGDRHNLPAHHLGAGRVSAMRRIGMRQILRCPSPRAGDMLQSLEDPHIRPARQSSAALKSRHSR